MKHVLSIIVLYLVSSTAFSSAQNYPTGKSILDKIDQNMAAKSRIMTIKMEVGTSKTPRIMRMKSWTVGSIKSFVEFIEPSRETGTKMLKINQQMWIYSPKTKRSIELSGQMLRQSAMGSDMSYGDMMNDGKLLEKYKAEVAGEQVVNGRKCWLLKLTAIVPQVDYYQQVLSVDKEWNVPLKIELYAKGDKLLKQTTLSDVVRIQGRWFPKTMVYKDMLKTSNETKISIEDVQFDVPIDEAVFSKANFIPNVPIK
jgi:outer membrane lipoprotein-sorting protein